jgi:hypothetical protein
MNEVYVEAKNLSGECQMLPNEEQVRIDCFWRANRTGRTFLKFLCVLIVGVLAIPALYGEDVTFTVVQSGPAAVRLSADGACSPGTLIGFSHPPSSDILLKITARTQDGSYTAVRFSPNDRIELLRPGDKGTAATPLHSSEPMSIALLGDSVDILRHSLEQALRNSPVTWVDAARKKPDVPIEVRAASGGSYTVTVSSEFESPRKFILRNLASPSSELIDFLKKDSANHYWLSLTNYYWQQTDRGSSWIDLVSEFDLTKNGEVPYNARIKLQATTQIKGYLCLMVVRENGEVLVLYPNTHRVDAESRALEPMFVNGDLKLELHAASSGPTHIILLISSTRRLLTDFMQSGLESTYLDLEGAKTHPDKIGPGLYSVGSFSQSIPRGQTVDDLPPDSWDVAKLSFTVAPKE